MCRTSHSNCKLHAAGISCFTLEPNTHNYYYGSGLYTKPPSRTKLFYPRMVRCTARIALCADQLHDTEFRDARAKPAGVYGAVLTLALRWQHHITIKAHFFQLRPRIPSSTAYSPVASRNIPI